MSRFSSAGVASAVRLVRAIASDRAALLFTALVEARAAASAPLAKVTLSALSLPTTAYAARDDGETRLQWLDAADQSFAAVFGFHMVDVARQGADTTAPDAAISIPATFLTFLEAPFPAADPARVPIVDGATAMWVHGVVAAAAGETGHHFAVRLAPSGPDCADFAGHLAAAGTADVRIAADAWWLAAKLLRAELHAGAKRPVIVVADEALVHRASSAPDVDRAENEEQRAETVSLAIEAMTSPLLPHFSRLRAVYVWRVPVGPLPRELDGVVAGCIGPLAFDANASTAMLALRAPHLGSTALAALQAMVADPRKAGPALAATAALATGNAIAPDQAALVLARSHGVAVARGQRGEAAFDPTLIMADVEPDVLLARAAHLARSGGRILFWGPPAGGKSSLAFALCKRMLAANTSTTDASREVVVIAAADILRTKWGATERLVRAAFTQAQSAGDAPLLIDEFDAFAGVREQGGATSNNGSLVRSLTDEFLRELDTFESVPVVATCNDLLSIDSAARRRFHLVVAVGDELTPEREARAWRVLLGRTPPTDWVPVGAAVGDIATAGRRCRMLGQTTSQDLLTAIVDAREARLGLTLAPRPARSIH